MKQFIATVFLGLGLCSSALANPSPIYQNFGVVDVLLGSKAPVVDATAFYNAGYFEVDTAFSGATFILGNFTLPYTTQDTLYYTNTSSGYIYGAPGYRFDTTTANNRFWASSFVNQGTVTGTDLSAVPIIFTPPGGTGFTSVPVESQPLSSQLLVFSTNIFNEGGTLSVGNYGLLQLYGKNVTNTYGAALLAGGVDTASDFPDPLASAGGRPAFDDKGFAVDAPSTYDLLWGIANGTTINLANLAGDLPDTGGIGTFTVTLRDGTQDLEFGLPVNDGLSSNSFAGYEAVVTVNPTNIYLTLVCINTNLLAANNITADVGFGSISPDIENFNSTNDDPNGTGVIIQFAEPVFDVITGETVTNGVYLLDSGAYLAGGMTLFNNAGSPDGYSRPNAIEITTITPEEWLGVFPGADFAFPVDQMGEQIYTDGQFTSGKTIGANIAAYGAQIGRDPEILDGSFFGGSLIDFILESNVPPSIAEGIFVALPDPTNDPGRIEINANNLDITQARIRAEGMVELNVTNLVGGGTGVADFGQANANIGATNGTLVISNLFPTTFRRVRGDIYAWEANWVNTQTNLGQFSTNNATAVTNLIHYHLLVVDQNLRGSFLSTIRNLNFVGKNSITVQDNLYVINQCSFATTNLTLNGTNTFTENAENLTPASMPNLKNLLVNTNAILTADGSLVVGFNLAQAQSGPVGRKYTVNSITNLGLMESPAPVLEAAIFENDGSVIAELGGSILIEANTLGLGLGLVVTNSVNNLAASGNVSLSGNFIRASNSFITAGIPGSEAGSLVLDATGQLTDFVSGTATTNTSSAIMNHWNVNGGGFSMPVKPAMGDLFGTEITTSVTNFQVADHVWAGKDWGYANGMVNTEGFSNNAVIGHLVLDRLSSNAVLHFSAAGVSNAMYVDYLDLTNLAFSDYRHGLVIDPNFTIYFADSNGDPEKLMEVYPRLVWAQNFNGPNSTEVVQILNCSGGVSSNVCLMNAALANSLDISFFNGIANFYNQPYVLNDPSDPCITFPCPGVETTAQSLLVTTRQSAGSSSNLVLNLVTITRNGEGAISPALQKSQVAMGQNYSLTATPSNGWMFDGWTTAGLSGGVNTQSPLLKFTLLTNTVITANFIPNPFTALKGVYNGLFFQTNGIDPGSSGAFTVTLAQSGSFSGRLLMGPGAYAFNSQFSVGGAAQVQAKDGPKSLTLNLQLDMSGQSGRIYGDVNGGAWDAALSGDIAPAWTAKVPSPLAARYTMALPWETGTLGTSGGDSYGVVTVNNTGVLTVGGALADGVAFSGSAPVSKYGVWPFYTYAAAGKDTVLGWVSVGSNGLAGTNVCWSKASGFTNVLQLVGSVWQAPGAKSPALSLTNPVVALKGGDLPKALTNAVEISQYLSYAATNVTLTINSSAGSFSGSFVSPGTGRRVTMSGVVLQNQDNARGFYVGTNQSGAVLLQDP